MRIHRSKLTLIVAIFLSLFAGCDSHGGSVTEQNTQVYFSPKGGRTQAVQAYSFTSAPIAKALVNAHKRGVKIEVILDKSQKTQNYSEADFIAHANIPTFIDSSHAIAHNKLIIIDGAIAITGSFNFSKAAEDHNAENLLVIHDKALAIRYDQNWQSHRVHSVAYEAR